MPVTHRTGFELDPTNPEQGHVLGLEVAALQVFLGQPLLGRKLAGAERITHDFEKSSDGAGGLQAELCV